jgi:hypothetical protein
MGPRAGRSCGKEEYACTYENLNPSFPGHLSSFEKLCIVSETLIENLTWNFDSLILQL